MSVDYNTYVGPFLRIRGDASAFFHETHVDVLVSVSEYLDVEEDETVAITNTCNLGFYADRESLGVTTLNALSCEIAREAFEQMHGKHMEILRIMGCEVSLEWGVISWAS